MRLGTRVPLQHPRTPCCGGSAVEIVGFELKGIGFDPDPDTTRLVFRRATSMIYIILEYENRSRVVSFKWATATVGRIRSSGGAGAPPVWRGTRACRTPHAHRKPIECRICRTQFGHAYMSVLKKQSENVSQIPTPSAYEADGPPALERYEANTNRVHYKRQRP
ncbi:hypothetical protein EVAR_94431_1 [Eumeta japonica]|uniref:Uncharacterized protein n=1 Tax=Eumeta variegata TaxID=151549 RepID=A0A4C1TQ44_EUMVA|nr:hypothetical protein EVAR_94431_1 [Eumeta japonica]